MHSRIRKIRLLRRLRKLRDLKRFGRDDRGVQLVELAIVLPIFILLFAATAEFGRYFYEYTTLAKSARVGARYLATACVNTNENTNAKNIVVFGNAAGTGTPILTGLSSTANVTITRNLGVPNLPQTVTVQITDFKHQPIFDLGKLTNTPALSMNIDVKPSVTMRYLLTQPCIPS
jgi:Flp pilus assembly protein TadG